MKQTASLRKRIVQGSDELIVINIQAGNLHPIC
jgi:hypothetical protein